MFYKKILKKINEKRGYFETLTEPELKQEVEVLKSTIALQSSTEERILVESFALVREVDFRVLGLFPTDEQVLGALALYDGKIAEMKTGEGKSLVATLPLFLKALYHEHVFLVTTNDYLAQRDYERIGPVFTWLGLHVAAGVNDEEETTFDHEKRKEVYSANIIYTSNSTLGFDFLIDGLAAKAEEKFMSPLRYALLDEVDEILLDSAQTPLIISGNPKVQSNYFTLSDQIITILEKDSDFKLDEENKSVWFTEVGLEKIKHYLSVDNLLEQNYFSLYQHLILSLKAHHLYKRERDYLVEDGKVKLLDVKDGRILEGTNLQNGLHQAIQAKEEVESTPETQTLSSITYQNLFRQFKSLAGMSGTAKVAEEEFISTYNLSVVQIDTHKKAIRRDHRSQRYVTFEGKRQAALEKIKALHESGRPVLVITGSVASSELFSTYLFDLGIPHNILNAKSSAKEAQIIREAGSVDAVTLSTTMAGRGTDIKIEEEALQLGGLAVVLTERMLNKRIELQAKGRAGRQGEPGDTYSFESLEDDVIRFFMKESVQNYYNKHLSSLKPIRNLRILRSFNNAQKKSEDKAYSDRLNALQFDEILRLQKAKVDESREQAISLSCVEEALALVYKKAEEALLLSLNKSTYDQETLQRYILDTIDYNFKREQFTKECMNNEEAKSFVLSILKDNLEKKRVFLNDEAAFVHYLKVSLLKSIDVAWSHQVNALNQLRFVVQPRSVAQKKAFIEYEREAQKNYDVSKNKLTQSLLRNVALSLFEIKKGELIVTFP